MRQIMFGLSVFVLMFSDMILAQNSTNLVQTAASLGPVVYNGSGCPNSTVSAVLSPDATAMSILFDDYVVRADSNTRVARKSCDIAIPINVPLGYQVTIIRADYRGFNDLPLGAESRFAIEYFLAGQTSTPYTEVFHGQLTSNYLLQNTVNTASVNWSACGQPVTFRINNNLAVYSNQQGEQAMASIDSTDVVINDPNGSRGLQFHFSWQPCSISGATSLQSSSWIMMIVPALAVFFAVH